MNESALDLTMISSSRADRYSWEVLEESIWGSDHYTTMCTVGMRVQDSVGNGLRRLIFGKAEWGQFQELSVCDPTVKLSVSEKCTHIMSEGHKQHSVRGTTHRP